MRYEGRLSGEGAKFELLSLGVVGSGTKLKQNRSKQMKENRWEYDKINAMELNEKQSKRNGRYKSKTKSSDRPLASARHGFAHPRGYPGMGSPGTGPGLT